MTLALAMLTIGASVLLAACSGAASSAGTSLEPFSPAPSPSMETSPSLASPSGSPDSMSLSASPN